MEVGVQPKLQFYGVDIPTVNFNSSSPVERQHASEDIEIKITPKVFYPKDQQREFQIVMDIKIFSENHFDLFILGIGKFTVNTEITEEIKKQLINVNAPAIMFPYVRSFITTFTSNLGSVTLPVILPPRFFRGQLEELSQMGTVDETE